MRPYRSSSFWYWCKLCAFHDNITRWGTTRERWVLDKNLQLIIFVSWTYVAPMHPTSFPLWPFIPSRVKSSLLACLCLTRYATIVWQEHVMWRNQTMVVKDYPLLHSTTSNTANKAQLPVGLLAQLVERCTGIAEVMGSNPVQAWIFSGLIFTTA